MLGSDSRGAGSTARADSILLMRTDPGKHLISMLSIPRDLLRQIPGHGRTKINAAYAYGGAPLLIRTINSLTGLQVNHIVLVNFAGFKELIDSMGGVTLYNKRKICRPSTFDGHNWVLPQGHDHLDGRRALAYSRIRHTTNPQDTDISRTERQQLVMQRCRHQLVSSRACCTCRRSAARWRSRWPPTCRRTSCSAWAGSSSAPAAPWSATRAARRR